MKLISQGTRALRRSGLAAFSRVNPGNINIRHHYTRDPIRLHSFRHKGYWFHGTRREKETMAAFSRLIRPGAQIIEAGGHIGYISMYFADLAGDTGAVHVFEPGPNNLPYVRCNTAHLANVTVIPEALGAQPGELPLFVEDLTGQNNSLVPNFAGLASNQRNAIKANVAEHIVKVTTIDEHAARTGLVPDLIKIDVEGYEWEVLAGARRTLDESMPVVMVEVQRNRERIAERFRGLGYSLHLADGTAIAEPPMHTVNVFCIPPGRSFPA